MSRKKTGCRSCMIATQTVSAEGVVTFGTPEPLIDLEELSYNYTYAEGTNYADNRQNIYKKKVTGADINLSFSDLSLETEAKIMGKQYNQGGIVTSSSDNAVAVALLFQETYDDGSYVNTVFYNVKLSKNDNSITTESDNIEFTAVGLSGRAIPLATGVIDFRMDSADPTVDTTALAAFFTTVQEFTPATP